MSKDEKWLKDKVLKMSYIPLGLDKSNSVISTNWVLNYINQLDEPTKITLNDVIARLDGLEKDNRLSWINKILHKFKMEYDDSKYQSGYEQGKVDGVAELQEKYTLAKKPVIPKNIADWFETYRDRTLHELINDVVNRIDDDVIKFRRWFSKIGFESGYSDFLARLWLDGYEVEKEPVWVVRTGENWYFKKFEEIDGNPIQGVGVGSIRLATKIFDKEKAEAIALLVGGEAEEMAR